MDGKKVIKILKNRGWTVAQQRGSHVRLKKGSLRTTVPVHGSRDIKIGTLKKIERDTGEKFS